MKGLFSSGLTFLIVYFIVGSGKAYLILHSNFEEGLTILMVYTVPGFGGVTG